MEYRYRLGDEIKTVKVERDGATARVSIDGAPSRVVRMTRHEDGVLDLHLDGVTRRVHVAREGQKRYAAIGSDVYEANVVERATRKHRAHSDDERGKLEAQMPGQVVAVNVRDGDAVTKGQTLVIIEAMKTELRVTAPYAGRVQKVLVMPGQVVERGQKLVEVVA